MSRVREVIRRNEFLRAGEISDQLEASQAELLTKRLYLEWAVADLRGLRIDGQESSLDGLIEKGPEDLTGEILNTIKQRLELSDAERKNF